MSKRTKLVVGIIAGLFTLCCFGGVLAAVASGGSKPNTNTETVATSTTAATSQAPPQTFSVDGNGKQLVDLKRTLNGAYKVEYKTDGNALIVQFLNAAGGDGTQMGMESINELNLDGSVSGSTIVHLTNVTMIQSDNTTSSWHLTFTQLS